MMFILAILVAIAVSVHAEGYGAPPAPGSVVAASAPYGAPYSTNSVSMTPQSVHEFQQQQYAQFLQQQQQQQQHLQLQRQHQTQPQPQPQQIPIGVQQQHVAAFPMGYGMYANAPTQLQPNPYQMYAAQQPLPNSLYVNYPQGMIIEPSHTTVPVAATSFISSPYGNPVSGSTGSSSGYTQSGYGSQTTIAAATGEEEARNLNAMANLTPAATTDPWAALGGVTTKKTQNKPKKDAEVREI
ncbi:unnamed protein product [Heligmosomoides polygyrus]|uniref:Secreted protein n=1 Tax=Heligmosomoides polygyrus TaxID=6339 RepID=A0A183G2Z6_HELPZ|nr:unnamed protein product [Heligmosomoides polygyrus]